MLSKLLNALAIFPAVSPKAFKYVCLINRSKIVHDFILNRPVVNGIPTILYIETTNRCNLDCKMCPRRLMTRSEEDMPLDRFKGILNQLDRTKTELIVLHSDGEPLLNPDFFEIVAAAKSGGFRVMTSTNATLLDEAKARMLIDSGLDVLTISIDGITPNVYEKIRRGGNFDRVMANVGRFLRIKKDQLPFTIMQMIEMTENSHQTDDFLRYFSKYANKNLRAVIKPLTEWFDEHKEIIDVYNYCDRPWFGMVVHSNGNVVPCVHDYDGMEVIGKVPEENIYDIWNCEQMVKLRTGILNKRSANSLCATCNATPPREFGLTSAIGLTLLDMHSISKILASIGYNRPRQY